MMNTNLPSLGIRFSIDKLEAESSLYGSVAWKTIFRAFPFENLSGETDLFEGDTGDTVQGREYVYCIVIQNEDRSLLDQIQNALNSNEEFNRVADAEKFVPDGQIRGEPLIPAGHVDAAGNLERKRGSNVGNVVVARRREQRLARGASAGSGAPSERKKPASARTAELPKITSLDELKSFLAKGFSKADQTFWYYLTPEELCDVVEQYDSLLQAHWCEDEGWNGDMATVVLINKAVKDGKNLKFNGLFPFASPAWAQDYCRDNQIDPAMWGIEGSYAGNFQGKFGNSLYSYEYDDLEKRQVDAAELWARICKRRSALEDEARRRAEEQQGRQQQHARRLAEERQRRAEEEKRRHEEVARRRAEDEKRQAQLRERKSQKQCVMCGKPLGLFDKLLLRDRHGGCVTFQE